MIWPEAEDEHTEQLLHDVRTVGWHGVHVQAEEPWPAHSFTVGLQASYGHPKLLIMA